MEKKILGGFRPDIESTSGIEEKSAWCTRRTPPGDIYAPPGHRSQLRGSERAGSTELHTLGEGGGPTGHIWHLSRTTLGPMLTKTNKIR